MKDPENRIVSEQLLNSIKELPFINEKIDALIDYLIMNLPQEEMDYQVVENQGTRLALVIELLKEHLESNT